MRARPSIAKRQRERTKSERKQQKAERKALRKEEQDKDSPNTDSEEDPDIAGIVPGPQPVAGLDDEEGDG